MSPTVTKVMFKMQKPIMSLKQFMLRSEVLKLYRAYLRLGKLLDEPPSVSTNNTTSSALSSESSRKCAINSSPQIKTVPSQNNPMKSEWTDWVRSEFRLRQTAATDEEMTRALLVHGKRQLQEMERSIMLATNRNTPSNKSKSSCKNNDKGKSDGAKGN